MRGTRLAAFALLLAACGGDAPHEAGGPSTPAPASPAASSEVPLRDLANESHVPLERAIAAATAKRPGRAVEAGLEAEVVAGARRVRLAVVVVGADGIATEVRLAPAIGEVTGEAPAADPAENAEWKAALDARGAALLPLADLVARGASSLGSAPLRAKYATSNGTPVARVRGLRGGELKTLVLDARTGEPVASPSLPK